jgi:hypothetical protein
LQVSSLYLTETTIMKVLGVISTTALLLLLGAAVPAYAQEEQHDKDAKPAKQEETAKPAKQEEAAKPASQEEAAKPASQEEAAKPAKQEEAARPAKQEEQAKPEKQQEAKAPKQEEQAKPVKQEEQAKQEDRGNNAGRQRVQRSPEEEKRQRAEPALRLSVRTESRIPDDRFRSNFGREHNFRIGSPTIVGGYSRFQYGGYWFGFVQPWPDDWYYTDDVYVDYIDGGYYLCNPSYPGVQIAISVQL